MEPAVEKKEAEQEEQQLPQARKEDAPAAAAAEEDEADSEETERRNRDLKAGLHPLRVWPAAARSAERLSQTIPFISHTQLSVRKGGFQCGLDWYVRL